MEKMYYAYKATSRQGLETALLMPLTQDAPIAEGQYFPESNVLVLLGTKSREVFDLIEKFKDDGSPDMNGKGQQKVERLRVQNNFNYQLTGDDIIWFASNYVVNSDFLISLVNQYKIKNVTTTPSNLVISPEEAKNYVPSKEETVREKASIVMTE